MNVLSLFDGISCGQVAFDKLGIKFNEADTHTHTHTHTHQYFASEIKSIAIDTTLRNYPNTIQVGDVTKLHYENNRLYKNCEYDEENDKWILGELVTNKGIDMLIGGSPCFLKGEMVNTINGYKNIEDITTNDYVYSHDGSVNKVIATMSSLNNNIYDIKCGATHRINTTGNHPFYIYRNGEYQWVESKDLTTEDFMCVPKNKKATEPNTIWQGYDRKINQFTSVRECNLPLYDDRFWYVIGRFLGDGWLKYRYRRNKKTPNSIIICCGKHELEDLKNKIGDVLHYYVSEEKTVYRLQFTNTELCNFCSMFGKFSYGKFIPQQILDLDVKYLRPMLNGIIDSDGSLDKNGYRITTTSKKLCYNIGELILKVDNIPYHINKTIRKPTCIIEGRECNQRDTYTIYCNKNYKDSINFITDNYLHSRIRKIDHRVELNTVYNIEVENTHSYCVNNIATHNCQNFSVANMYDRRGLEGEKSKLFYEYLRLKNEINPKYFLLENVKMSKDNEQKLNDYMGVNGIHINSNKVSFQDRRRIYWTNIPNVTQPQDKCVDFQAYKDNNKERCDEAKVNQTPSRIRMWNNGNGYNGVQACDNITNAFNIHCLTRKQDRCPNSGLIAYDDFCRFLTRRELELAQTLPIGYCDNLSLRQVEDVTGDGWTVDVIKHIFSFIPEIEEWKNN